MRSPRGSRAFSLRGMSAKQAQRTVLNTSKRRAGVNRNDLDRLALGPPGVPTRISPKNEPHSFRPQDHMGKGSSPYRGGKKVGKGRPTSRVIVSTRPKSLSSNRRVSCPKCNCWVREDRLHAHLQKAHAKEKTVTRKPTVACPQCGVPVIKLSKHLRKAHSFPWPLAVSVSKHLRKAQAAPTQTPPVVVVKKKLSPHRRKAHPAPGLVKPPKSKLNLKPPQSESSLVGCPQCGCPVKKSRLPSHLARVHRDLPKTSHRRQQPASVSVASPTSNEFSRSNVIETNERQMDYTRPYAHAYREHGRFGSHPSHDDFGDESKP